MLQELLDFVVDVSDEEHANTALSGDHESASNSGTGSNVDPGNASIVGKRSRVASSSPQPSPCRRRTAHQEDHVDATAGSESESGLCFEDDSSCDEFIPRGATRACAGIFVDNPPVTKPLPRLPNELRARIPADGLSSPMELAAVGLLQEGGVASRALHFVARKARPLSEAALPALRKRLRQWGYDSNALARVLSYVRDEAPIIVHIDLASRLGKLRADTHYRNQFETGTTCGSSNLSHRKAWEDRLFEGIYENAAPHERVKYGVLNMVNDPCGIATVSKQYGKDYLVLRGIRLRTTFSDKDSCNVNGKLASCEWYAHVLEKYSDLELRAVTEVALGDRLFVDSDVLSTSAGGYKEVQIHGELILDKHVEMVVAHPSRRDTPIADELHEWCVALGIRFEFMPNKTVEGNSNPESPLVAETPLWCWRPPGREWATWIRFSAFESSSLEEQWKRKDRPLPAWPIGILSSIDLNDMTAIASVGDLGDQKVTLELQRRTPGACAQQRAAESSGASESSTKKAVTWEWCASTSGNSTWSAYDAKLRRSIETSFLEGSSTSQFSIKGILYRIDLDMMVQVNTATGYRRLVRRTQPL